MKPLLFQKSKYGSKEIEDLKRKFKPKIVDIYSRQRLELAEVKFEKINRKKNQEISSDWIYYGWSNILLHALTQQDNDLLRTNRNKNLITADEQEKLSDFTIGIAGLSVGGNIATALLHNGFPKKLKLADPDVLDTTNLNRVRVKLSDVGGKKIDVISRQLYEIDPYVIIAAFPNGSSERNLKDFVAGDPKPKLIFELIDDFKMKVLIRREAKKYKIPVVMLTSLGDSVLIDIERYDKEPKTRIFNGMVSEKIIEKILSRNITKEDKQKYAVQITGRENVPQRALESIKEIGKTLVGRPQLMSTVTVASGIAVFIARKIALGEKVLSGRTLVKFNDFIKT